MDSKLEIYGTLFQMARRNEDLGLERISVTKELAGEISTNAENAARHFMQATMKELQGTPESTRMAMLQNVQNVTFDMVRWCKKMAERMVRESQITNGEMIALAHSSLREISQHRQCSIDDDRDGGVAAGRPERPEPRGVAPAPCETSAAATSASTGVPTALITSDSLGSCSVPNDVPSASNGCPRICCGESKSIIIPTSDDWSDGSEGHDEFVIINGISEGLSDDSFVSVTDEAPKTEESEHEKTSPHATQPAAEVGHIATNPPVTKGSYNTPASTSEIDNWLHDVDTTNWTNARVLKIGGVEFTIDTSKFIIYADAHSLGQSVDATSLDPVSFLESPPIWSSNQRGWTIVHINDLRLAIFGSFLVNGRLFNEKESCDLIELDSEGNELLGGDLTAKSFDEGVASLAHEIASQAIEEGESLDSKTCPSPQTLTSEPLPTDEGQTAEKPENPEIIIRREGERILQAYFEAERRLQLAYECHSTNCEKSWTARDAVLEAQEQQKNAERAYVLTKPEESDHDSTRIRWHQCGEAAQDARVAFRETIDVCRKAKEMLVEAKEVELRAARECERVEREYLDFLDRLEE